MKLTRRGIFASLLGLAVRTPAINRLPFAKTRWEAINRQVQEYFLRSAAIAFKYSNYENDFGKKGAKIGDRLTIRRPARYTHDAS